MRALWLQLGGGAVIALPLLFWGRPLYAAGVNVVPVYGGGSSMTDQSSLTASWMLLSINPAPLNAVSDQIGYPDAPGGGMSLFGGGAMIQTGLARCGVMGWTGGMGSNAGAFYSNWNLDLAGLVAEQRYPVGSIDILGGVFTGVGQFGILYRNNNNLTNFESRFPASGATLGVHWPVSSRMSFLLRGGYLWLPASGTWQGSFAPNLTGSTYFQLSAPFAELDINLAL